jgi:lipopolysaccharide export system permease protein
MKFRILTKYVLKEHIGPFLFGFITVIFVFLVQFLTRTLDKLVGKGLDTGVIVELILLQIAWMVVLAAPMAVLISTLMTFGNLTNALEMTAMRAGGISVVRIMLPVLAAGLTLAWLTERFGNVALPEANHRAKVLMMDVSRQKPSFGLKDGVFSDMMYGYSILVNKTFEQSPGLKGITIYDYTDAGKTAVVVADSGFMEFSRDGRYLLMTLVNGEMHETDKETQKSYRKVNFMYHKVLFDATGYGFERSDESAVSRGDRELSADDMLYIVDSLSYQLNIARENRLRDMTQHIELLTLPQSLLMPDGVRLKAVISEQPSLSSRADSVLQTLVQPDATPPADSLGYLRHVAIDRRDAAADQALTVLRNNMSLISNHLYRIGNYENNVSSYMVEVHKKYALPFACFFFVLVGVPLGVMAKRGGFGIGAGLSLLFFLVYWAFLIGGEKLADRAIMPPSIAMWLGNIVIFFVGIVLVAIVSGVNFSGLTRWVQIARRKNLPTV